MPLYVYVCPECDLEIEEIRPFALADAPMWCPVCGSACGRGILQMTGRRIRLVLGEPWKPNEQPFTQIVVIGTHGHVDSAELHKRFQFALASEVAQRKSFMPDVVEWLRGAFKSPQAT